MTSFLAYKFRLHSKQTVCCCCGCHRWNVAAYFSHFLFSKNKPNKTQTYYYSANRFESLCRMPTFSCLYLVIRVKKTSFCSKNIQGKLSALPSVFNVRNVILFFATENRGCCFGGCGYLGNSCEVTIPSDNQSLRLLVYFLQSYKMKKNLTNERQQGSVVVLGYFVV